MRADKRHFFARVRERKDGAGDYGGLFSHSKLQKSYR